MHEIDSNTARGEVERTMKTWVGALGRGDVQAIMAHYADEVLAFDAVQALQFKGAQAYGAHWKACMEMCPGPMIFQLRDPVIHVAGDFACAYGLIRCGMVDEQGKEQASWMRMTSVYRRQGDKWLIEHEHFSAPFDMRSWKALFDLQPDGGGAVSPIPPSMSAVTPHLVCKDAAGAIEFYKKAFDAREESRLHGPDGKIVHACLRIGESAVFLAEENLEWGAPGPRQLKGTPVGIHLYVRDVDAQAKKLDEASAKAMLPVRDMFWGDRYGVYEDPYGHRWSIASHVRDLTPEEIEEAGRKMIGSPEMCASSPQPGA
ncbi:ketosteroid isomerase-like protein/uncharacterized glyoxalase superfamily protein PhnB [Parapusillimonas granuli]|uniref:Nuclear transport factor 2 family protein n=2 Tax=Parapusillimonas granuli TaxID=380911 RepID=A0A853G0B1_9BURK|nr:ketosteroid isomerase-like protein/uncharacterized glyoxalase superfamily protein PhnB [Parapusillimonas granuli]NYT50293.1 nuclear transport factor 2 family protein [Parapusillimonas granuli]